MPYYFEVLSIVESFCKNIKQTFVLNNYSLTNVDDLIGYIEFLGEECYENDFKVGYYDYFCVLKNDEKFKETIGEKLNNVIIFIDTLFNKELNNKN